MKPINKIKLFFEPQGEGKVWLATATEERTRHLDREWFYLVAALENSKDAAEWMLKKAAAGCTTHWEILPDYGIEGMNGWDKAHNCIICGECGRCEHDHRKPDQFRAYETLSLFQEA